MQKRRAFGYHGKGKAHTSMKLKIKLLPTKEGKIEQIKAAGDETDDKYFDKGRYGPVNLLTSYILQPSFCKTSCRLHLSTNTHTHKYMKQDKIANPSKSNK